MLGKWKKPKAFFLAVTEGKFHNRGVLFSLASGHENIIEKTQKSAVVSPRSTRPNVILFSMGANPFLEEINEKSLQVT